MKNAEKLYKSLADANRLRILKMLEVKPMCGCGVSHVLEIVQSAVSRHLKLLEDAGLVVREREGSYVLYSLNPHPASKMVSAQLELIRSNFNEEELVKEDKSKAVRIDLCDFE